MSIIQHRRQYNLIKIKYLGARAFSGRYRKARRSLAGKALRVKSLHTFLYSISGIESHVRCYIIIRYVPGDDAEEKGRERTGRKDGRGREGRPGTANLSRIPKIRGNGTKRICRLQNNRYLCRIKTSNYRARENGS